MRTPSSGSTAVASPAARATRLGAVARFGFAARPVAAARGAAFVGCPATTRFAGATGFPPRFAGTARFAGALVVRFTAADRARAAR